LVREMLGACVGQGHLQLQPEK